MRSCFPLIVVVAMLAAACSAPEEDASDVGGFAVGLTDEVDGVSYRLRKARFRVSGPTRTVLSSEGSPDATSIEAVLRSGAYRVSLQPGWALEDVDTGQLVEAQLESPSSLDVEIRAGTTTNALFRFQVSEGAAGKAPRVKRSRARPNHPLAHASRKYGKLEVWIDVTPREARAWRGPLQIGPNVEWIASSPRVTIDASGNAVAVWAVTAPVWDPNDENDSTGVSIMASRFVAGSGWGAFVQLSNDTSFPWSPSVGGNASGNAVAIWQQDAGIWGSHFDVASGWGSPVQIGEGEMHETGPQIVMDAAGNAIAAWEHEGIWVNRFEVGAGWGTALPITSSDVGAARFPQLAITPAGSAVATFQQQFVNGAWRPRACRFEVGSGWTAAAELQNEITDAGAAWLAMDTAGNAIATWGQSDGTSSAYWFNRYLVGRGWIGAAPFATVAGPLGGAQVAIDDSGSAIAIWTQLDGADYNLVASRFETASGWSAPTVLDNGTERTSARIAMNGAGSAVVVWDQITAPGVINVWRNHFTPRGGWEGGVRLDSATAWSSVSPQIAMNAAGDAVAVWVQWWSEDWSRIWSNRFD